MHYFLHAEMLHLFLSVSSFDMLMFHGRVTYSVSFFLPYKMK